MKYIYLTLLLIVVTISTSQISIAQEVYDYEAFTKEASEYIEKEDYESAIKIYDKVHKLDPNYPEALGYKAELLNELERIDEAAELLEELYKNDFFDRDPELYITYGSILDSKKEYEKSEEVYTQGEEKYPRYSYLLFNKAVMYYNSDQTQKCVDYLKKSITINPDLIRAHYLLGAIAFENGRLAEGFMASLAYLVNNPTDNFSTKAILSMNVKMAQNYLEETEIIFSEEGDDFSELNLILRNQLPLNKKYKLNCDIDDNYPRYVQAVMEYATEHESNNGFFEKTYIPWMKSLHEKGLTENFIYFSLQGLDGKIGKTVKRKTNDIDRLSNEYFSKDFWSDFAMREKIHFGEKKNVITYIDNGVPSMIGELKDGKKEGKFEYLDKFGRKTIEANYVNSEAQGLVRYFDGKGNVQEETEFKDDVKNGWQKYYNEGQPYYEVEWKEGKKNGAYKSYHLLGGLDCVYKNEDDVVKGDIECFHNNGENRYKAVVENDELNGKREVFYVDGKLSFEEHYKDGELNGIFKDYGSGGELLTTKNFKDNEVAESYEVHDELGNLILKSVVEGNTRVESRYDQGKVDFVHYYKNDKVQKAIYYDQGVENYSFLYKDEELKAIKLITKDQPKGKKLKLGKTTFYDLDGVKLSYKEYKKTKLNGISEYYFLNGKVSSRANYVDDKVNGLSETYTTDGNIDLKQYFKEGELHGESLKYENENLRSKYNYKEGKLNGPFEVYYNDGTISIEGFFRDGERIGTATNYNPDGTKFRKDFYEDDILVSQKYYYKSGELDYEKSYKNLTGEKEYKSNALEETSTINYKNGVIDGLYTFYHNDGVIAYKGEYINDLKHGLHEYFSPNGKIRHRTTFKYNRRVGESFFYNEDGSLRTKNFYLNGEETGEEFTYYQDGNLRRYINNWGDKKMGPTSYLNRKGDTLVILGYEYDLIKYYILPDENGEFTEKIVIDNSKHEIETKYENGNVAASFSIYMNYLDGSLKFYAEDGTMLIEENYQNDKLHGKRIEYFENGKVFKNENFIFNDYEGVQEYFNDKGEIVVRVNFKEDSRDGDYEIFENGKLIKTKVFKDDNLYEIK